jgi:hypothetical protein
MGVSLTQPLTLTQKCNPRPLNGDAELRTTMLVPETGLEPVRGCPQRFLSPTSGDPH